MEFSQGFDENEILQRMLITLGNTIGLGHKAGQTGRLQSPDYRLRYHADTPFADWAALLSLLDCWRHRVLESDEGPRAIQQ